MNTPVTPLDCDHRHRLFVQEGRGMGDFEYVGVCPDCGEFHVSLNRGTRGNLKVNFTLPTWELVGAAAQYARLLDLDCQKPTGAVAVPGIYCSRCGTTGSDVVLALWDQTMDCPVCEHHRGLQEGHRRGFLRGLGNGLALGLIAVLVTILVMGAIVR